MYKPWKRLMDFVSFQITLRKMICGSPIILLKKVSNGVEEYKNICTQLLQSIQNNDGWLYIVLWPRLLKKI